MRFQILASSSSGNCALLQTAEATILIDAGISARRIKVLLAGVGLRLEDLDAVFVTHEHQDHCIGLRGLAKCPGLKVFANRPTLECLRERYPRASGWQCFETGSRFRFRDLEVNSFDVPHDASEPVGFSFRCGDGTLFDPFQQIVWVTDLGSATTLVRQRIQEADILVIEANHDPALLEASQRPWSTKQRIRGRHGHLSNDEAFRTLAETERPRWKRVYLAHISRECNDVPQLRAQFEPLARARRVPMEIVAPEGPLPTPLVTGLT